MKGHHSSKTISFLMELIFVLFFFTIASAISVFVIVNAKDKNEHAIHSRRVLTYAQNLISNQDKEEISSYLEKDSFYLDEQGTPKGKKDKYRISIARESVEGLEGIEQCIMSISLRDDTLVKLSFVLDKGDMR